MLPRFHDSSFIYDVWHSAFWNYVASIPCSLFKLRYFNSGIMLPRFYVPFSFYGMCILNYGIMLPRFHDSSFIYDIITTFAFCTLEIMFPRFYVPFFFHGMCILELCRLDSIITDYLRTVFEMQRIYYTVVMLPRFHRVRTRRPGNSL